MNSKKKTGDDEIGDEFEGMFHINEGSLSIPEKGEKIILNDTLIQTADSDDFVFCMLAINPSLNEFSFSDKQKEKILSFGDTALVVLDSEEFIRRVCLAAERNGYGVHFNTVKYFNPMTDSANMIFSLSKGMWNIAFWKRDKYAYQQEGRFVFTPRKRK